MRKYELIFIVRPDVPDEEVEKLIGQMQGVVTGTGSTMEKAEKMGKRRLAYRIGRHREGHYVLFVFEGGGETVKEFERRLKVNDAVVKYLTVRTDEGWKRAGKLKAARAERAATHPKPKPAAAPPVVEAVQE